MVEFDESLVSITFATNERSATLLVTCKLNYKDDNVKNCCGDNTCGWNIEPVFNP